MNKSEKRWLNFKHELPSVLYLCIIQIVLNFTFPPFSRLEFHLSTIFPTILSITTTCCYFYTFLYADKFISSINLEYLDEAPDNLKYIFKNMERIGFIVIIHLGMFLAWYYNIHNISGIYYIIYYLHSLVACILIYRAVKRSEILRES